MANKMLGYILMGVGLIVFLLSWPGIRALAGIASIGISDIYLSLIGIVVLLVGAYIGFRGSRKKVKEVPIYKGKEVVGYRVISEK